MNALEKSILVTVADNLYKAKNQPVSDWIKYATQLQNALAHNLAILDTLIENPTTNKDENIFP